MYLNLLFGTSACALVFLLSNSFLSRRRARESNKSTQVAGAANNTAFREFRVVYLAGYLLATGADWLQGPWMYALYEAYGLSAADISLLFVAGYASSMTLGTAVGALSDTYGRKRFCLLYCLLYSISCLTKHVNSFWWLLAGRIVSGMSTSLLHSAFESWVVAEHKNRNLPQNMLPRLFSSQAFCNSLVAITVGLISQVFFFLTDL
jgi:MFS family permease